MEGYRAEYEQAVARCSDSLKGKKVVFVVSSFFDIDWAVECLADAGADVATVFVYRMGKSSPVTRDMRCADSVPIVRDLPIRTIIERVQEIGPDLIIGSKHVAEMAGCHYAPISFEALTHYASINYLEFIDSILRTPMDEGWKSWGDGL